MGVVVRRYIDILTIIINFPYSTCIMHLSMLRPTPPCTGIGGDLTHRMCQIPHPSITIQCQIPTLYIRTRICAGTRANACAGQKPHPWCLISWRIPYQAPPLSPTGGGWGVTLIGANSSFVSSSTPTSLFILKCFFRSCFCYFFTIYSKRYSKNIRDRSKKSRPSEYNYLIISIIKNVERASTARARESRDFHVRGTE